MRHPIARDRFSSSAPEKARACATQLCHRATLATVYAYTRTRYPTVVGRSILAHPRNPRSRLDSSSAHIHKAASAAMKYARQAALLLLSAASAGAFALGGTATTAFARRSLALAAKLPIMADESIMGQKKHGTSEVPVQKDLRWGCDVETADRICNFNRHYAEFAGYWATTKYLQEVDMENPTEYYDSNTGKLLFTAPISRSMDDYLKESQAHGWPSFRDEEVNWDYVRCLPNGECISVDGTHLGHNLPDAKGNRYCINLVSVAGNKE